ncbi:hypothetical protein BV25DRAFT_1825148, partial [Artomyces pyxidatus]
MSNTIIIPYKLTRLRATGGTIGHLNHRSTIFRPSRLVPAPHFPATPPKPCSVSRYAEHRPWDEGAATTRYRSLHEWADYNMGAQRTRDIWAR